MGAAQLKRKNRARGGALGCRLAKYEIAYASGIYDEAREALAGKAGARTRAYAIAAQLADPRFSAAGIPPRHLQKIRRIC